ncbi:MAG: SDR family NAD(P)-dependent oxidoreductase, partial [Alphaproteobacteria bacterium]|nr:SDR family NAD(P)-dependent oxidoreductase [Alphaproteobacteria bacterium]
MRMKDRVALVTGVGGPMGAAVATRLGEEGAKLIVTDISGRRLEERAKTLPGNPVVLRADNRLEEENARVVEAGLARFGRIDVLVNVVGGIRDSELYRPLLEMTETRWNETF